MKLLNPTADDIAHLAEAKVTDQKVRERIIVERAVVRHACNAIFAAGAQYTIRIHNGEAWACDNTRDIKVVMAAIMQTDEEYIYVYSKTGVNAKRGFPYTKIGWILLVYGNDGWDVIADHTVTLQGILKSTDTFVDTLS